MSKKTLMPVISLTVICVAVAILMGFVNMLTSPKIEENALKKEQEALFEVLSSEKDGFDAVEGLKDLPATVSSVYKAKGGAGYVVSLATSTNYSSGDMLIVVGIDDSGAVTGIKINSYNESKDFGKESYPENFVGKNVSDYSSVDTVSGVTYSSSAFKAAIGDAFVAVGIAKGESVELPSDTETSAPEDEEKPQPALPKTDSEIAALFSEMAGVELDLEDVTSTDERVKRIYKDKNGLGVFAYLITSTQWVPVETEGAVYIDANGDIQAIKLLTWTVGHGVDYTEEYLSSFENKDRWHTDGIIHVSEATGTSNNFKNAVTAALEIADTLLPRTEKKLTDLMSEMVQNEEGFVNITPENAPATLKALYKETSGKGYVAYTVTSTQWVSRETEALTYIDSFGTVKSVRVLTWTVGHGIDYTDEYLKSFEGKTAEELAEGVELVSHATGTSEHLRDAIIDAMSVVPSGFPILSVIALATLVLSVAAFAVILVYNRKRRAPK